MGESTTESLTPLTHFGDLSIHHFYSEYVAIENNQQTKIYFYKIFLNFLKSKLYNILCHST